MSYDVTTNAAPYAAVTYNGMKNTDKVAGYEVIVQIDQDPTMKIFVSGASSEEAQKFVLSEYTDRTDIRVIAAVRVIK